MMYLLGLISLCVAITTSKVNIFKAAVPGICERVNNLRKECPGQMQLYRIFDHSCPLKLDNSFATKEATTILNIPKEVKSEKNSTCTKNAEKYRRCSNNMRSRGIQLEKTKSRKYTRLLMLHSGVINQEARQYNLHNKSVTTYPHLRTKRATAVAYITTSRKLLISDAGQRELFLISLNDKDKRLIKRGTVFSGITVDDQKQQVFLASSKPHKIQVMTTEGKQIRLLARVGSRIGSIAVDSKTQIIYVAVFSKYIVSYSYKGVSQKIIVKGYIRNPICLSSETNSLYYLEGMFEARVFKVSPTNGIVYSIEAPLKPCSSHLYVFSNDLYLTPNANRAVLSVLSESGKQTGIIKTGYGGIGLYFVLVCAIP